MSRSRAISIAMLAATLLLVAGGCANLRLPAIDPSGQRFFLPNPNYTTFARDGFLSRLHNGEGLGGGIGSGPLAGGLAGRSPNAVPLPGPYQPAFAGGLFNHDTTGLRRLHERKMQWWSNLVARHQDGPSLFGQRSRSPATLFGNAAYPRVPEPPQCGADGRAPADSPCYPVGSPSASSLAASVSNSGAGYGPTGQPGGAFAAIGPGVVVEQPRYTARVGQEVVVLGGILSGTGIPRGNEPVKWSLSNDSVGTIIDAARPVRARPGLLSFLHRAGSRRKAADCGSCVASVTAERCRIVTRRPGDPRDDVYLSKGQSWVSVTSGSPGQSFVTLAAPDLRYGRRVTTAIIDWTDATWECPQPALSSLEGPGQLITRVFKNADQSPLSRWNVRYTYIDGPKVRLSETDTTAVVANVSTDARGRAIMTAYPESTESGTTRFGIQIFDPDSPAKPVCQCIGYITWSESEPVGAELQYPDEPPYREADEGEAVLGPPQYGPGDEDVSPEPFEPFEPQPESSPFSPENPATVDDRVTPPTTRPEPQPTRLAIRILRQTTNSVAIGEPVEVQVEIRNISSNVLAERVSVVSRTDPNRLRFVASQPAPVPASGLQAWELGDIPAGQRRVIRARYNPVDAGQAEFRFEAGADNGVGNAVTDTAAVDISANVIDLRVTPPARNPRVGQEFELAAELLNRSTTLRKVSLTAKAWSPGLVPNVGNSRINPAEGFGPKENIDLPSGPSGPIGFPFRAVAAGPQEVTFEATVPGTTIAPVIRQVFVTIASPPEPKPNIVRQYYQQMPAGQSQVVDVRVENNGNAPLTNVKLRYRGDPDLFLTGDSTKPTAILANGLEYVWELGDVQPGPDSTRLIQVGIQAAENPAKRRASHSVSLSSNEGDLPAESFEFEIVPTTSQRGIRVQRAGLISNAPTLPEATANNLLQATIQSIPSRVHAGEKFQILVDVNNRNENGFRDLAVGMELSKNLVVVQGSGPPLITSNISPDGHYLRFGLAREILAGERLTYQAWVLAKQTGAGKVVARAEAIGLLKPVIVGTEVLVQ